MLILRGEIGKQQGLKAAKAKHQQAEKDLHRILKKWKFGGKPMANTEEFLTKIGGWVDKQIDKSKEWEDFMTKFKINNLNQIKEVKL